MRRFRVPLILALIGSIFWMVGALFKILHWGFGVLNPSMLLLIGTSLGVLASLFAIVILLRIKKD